jgi:hypothetical protein
MLWCLSEEKYCPAGALQHFCKILLPKCRLSEAVLTNSMDCYFGNAFINLIGFLSEEKYRPAGALQHFFKMWLPNVASPRLF